MSRSACRLEQRTDGRGRGCWQLWILFCSFAVLEKSQTQTQTQTQKKKKKKKTCMVCGSRRSLGGGAYPFVQYPSPREPKNKRWKSPPPHTLLHCYPHWHFHWCATRLPPPLTCYSTTRHSVTWVIDLAFVFFLDTVFYWGKAHIDTQLVRMHFLLVAAHNLSLSGVFRFSCLLSVGSFTFTSALPKGLVMITRLHLGNDES